MNIFMCTAMQAGGILSRIFNRKTAQQSSRNIKTSIKNPKSNHQPQTSLQENRDEMSSEGNGDEANEHLYAVFKALARSKGF